MAMASDGIPLSTLSPQYLSGNAASHPWLFGAIAELIDNAYDPDVKANKLWIDWTQIENMDCLIFMDNGAGMDYKKMHKMLSFGFSDKKTVRDHVPVGVYGNGFKSGSMRLGKDAIVFSKNKDSMNVGLLSQSYLEAIKAENIVVPIITFRQDEQGHVIPEHADSLEAILRYSLFKTERDLLRELEDIDSTSPKGSTGTRIIIWNLKKTEGKMEFDFETDRYDIRIPRPVQNDEQENLPVELEPMSRYSLCAYSSILYLKPRMQIIIRGQKVKTQLISKSLAYIRKDCYKPKFVNKNIKITFGYNPKKDEKEHYGLMMYHKNRLIKAYERVGCQRKTNYEGVGVIGVVECNFLKPTHNKQNFDDTEEYRKVIYNLGVKLEEYWKEIKHKKRTEDPSCTVAVEDIPKVPDQNWAQCDDCMKWRKLPDGIDPERLPKKWFCHLNPNPKYRSCQAEQEPEDSEDERPYKKTYKLEKKKQEQAKKQQQNFQVAGPSRNVLTTPTHRNSLRIKLKESFYTPPSSFFPRRTGVSRSVDRMPMITSVCSMATGLRGKRKLDLNGKAESQEAKRANGLYNATDQHNNASEPEENAASSELCPSPLALSQHDDDDGDDDIVVIEESSMPRPGGVTFDFAKVKTEHQDSEGGMEMMHLAMSRSAEGTEMESMVELNTVEASGVEANVMEANAVEASVMEANAMEASAMETDATDADGVATAASPPSSPHQQISIAIQTGHVPIVKEEKTEERKGQKSTQEGGVEGRAVSTEQREPQQEEARQDAVVVEERPTDGASTFTPAIEELQRLLQEAQQQQDQLMELMQIVAQERDRYKEQLMEAVVKKEKCDQATETEQQEDGAMQDSREGELAQQVEPLLRDLDQKNKENDELKSKLESIEVQRDSLSSQCEKLKSELEELREEMRNRASSPSTAQGEVNGSGRPGTPGETNRLRSLRQGVARLLVTFVPALELDQVNYDCNVIDEMLDQVLDDIEGNHIEG